MTSKHAYPQAVFCRGTSIGWIVSGCVDVPFVDTYGPRAAWVATAFARLEADKTAYVAVTASALLAEFVQQVVGDVDLVRTIPLTASRNFYIEENLHFAPAHVWALLMYAGTPLWLLSAAFFVVYVLRIYVMIKPRAFDISSDHGAAL